MTYRDVLDILLTRAQRLGLVDPETGKADSAELQLYLYQALLSLVETTDLEEYTMYAPVLVATSADIDTYALPTDFGRLIAPRALSKRGLTLVDGLQVVDLDYEEPNALLRQPPTTSQRPTAFTIIGRALLLFPPPDDNGGTPYVIRGLYIQQVPRPALSDTVLLQHPDALIQETLWLLAGDMGKLAQNAALIATRNEAVARLVGNAVNAIQRQDQAPLTARRAR